MKKISLVLFLISISQSTFSQYFPILDKDTKIFYLGKSINDVSNIEIDVKPLINWEDSPIYIKQPKGCITAFKGEQNSKTGIVSTSNEILLPFEFDGAYFVLFDGAEPNEKFSWIVQDNTDLWLLNKAFEKKRKINKDNIVDFHPEDFFTAMVSNEFSFSNPNPQPSSFGLIEVKSYANPEYTVRSGKTVYKSIKENGINISIKTVDSQIEIDGTFSTLEVYDICYDAGYDILLFVTDLNNQSYFIKSDGTKLIKQKK